MAKTKRRQAFAEQYVFSAEEFEASGIRELSFEELLKVNGGKVVKDDPWTDKNSETCPYSSNAPRTDSSSGSSGGGSSSSNYGSSSGGSSSTNSDSSGYSEPVTGSHSDDSGGSTCDGWNNYWNGLTSGGSSGGGSSGSTGGSSGGSSSGGDSSAPPSSSPSEPVTGSDSDDTGGSTCDGWNNYWNGLTSGGSSGGGSSGSTGGSSGNSDSSGGSSSDDSSDDDCSSGGSSGGGSSWSGDYTPPVQSQPVPKPNKGEEASPTQGGGAPRGEAVAMMRNQPETIVSSEKPSNAEIKKKADNYNHHRYIKGKQEFRCDNYVEAVIKDCGLDSLKYLAGAATEKNVEQHITNAKEKQFAVKSERYNPQNLQDGTYVVLMNNSDKNFNAHAGIIFQEGGKTEYRDNSSCNTWKDNDGIKFEGGVIQQDYSDLGAFQADYGYNDFYYIRIN